MSGRQIEFMPWYQPGSEMMRCGGDDGCAALLIEGDIEVHRKWHEKVERSEGQLKGLQNRIDNPQNYVRTQGAW